MLPPARKHRQARAPTRGTLHVCPHEVLVEEDGIAQCLVGGSVVKGNQGDRTGYFSEFFHKYVRFVRLKGCFGCSLGADPGFVSMLTMLLSRGVGPRRSFLLTGGQLVVVTRSWRSPARPA